MRKITELENETGMHGAVCGTASLRNSVRLCGRGGGNHAGHDDAADPQ